MILVRRSMVLATLAVAAGAGATASPASAASRSCAEPGAAWQRATPAEVGLDAQKLKAAVDYVAAKKSYAVRVYRHGCLVAEDSLASLNRRSQYESWSMAKSVTSMVFGRAMTLGLIGPDDPVGALVPEADKAHGAITVRHLLTMSSGLRWNGLRDYNILTMRDRLRDALTLDVVHKPGTYYEYAQSAVSLLAEAVSRAVGEDFQTFAQRELMGPLGIQQGTWKWIRDAKGRVLGFMGVEMRPDDFARLGELMRRGGAWHGQRLLSREYMRDAIAPSAANSCYGWLIWLNRGGKCVGPTVANRPVSHVRDFPSAPEDVYNFSGLFDQRVTVFPTQELVFVRVGAPAGEGVNLASGGEWEDETYKRLLGAIVDESVVVPKVPDTKPPARTDPDYGFGQSLLEPGLYSQGAVPQALGPAGPVRARAVRVSAARLRVKSITLRIYCPPRLSGRPEATCTGEATLAGAPLRAEMRRAFSARPGETVRVKFPLRAKQRRALRRASSERALTVTALVHDAAGGTATAATVR